MQDIERIIIAELRASLGSIRGYLDQVTTQNIFRELLFLKLLNNQVKIKNDYFSNRITRNLNFEEYIEDSKEFFKELKLLLNENSELKNIVVEVNESKESARNELLKKIFISFTKMNAINKVEPKIVFKYFLDLSASENPMSIPSEPTSIRCLINKLLEEKNIKTIYDPTIGTGMLITDIANSHKNSLVYGQDMSSEMVRVCKMVLILDRRIDEVHNIKEGNILINPRHILDDKLKTFDCVVSNPPIKAMNWGFEEVRDSDKFNRFYRGLPPKSIGDYGFITQMVESLNEKGVGVIIETAGILFRGGKEGSIRKALIEENLIETIIVLPNNMLYRTGIQINLLIFNKNKNEDKVFFIDVSKMIETNKRLTIIEKDEIEKIGIMYKEKIEIEGISRKVSRKEIEENSFNLSIQRYIKEKVEEENVDTDGINNEIYRLERELIEIQKRLNKCFN